MCEGTVRSCFAMTEPEVAGSDPTLMQTRAVLDGDEWVVNGHKWFISGARGAQFAILMARTEDDPEVPQAATSAFIVDVPSPGWEIVRDVETMAGSHNHCEIRITDLRVPDANRLGDRGQGHRLGQYRLGPARLAHCMRWLGQIETALDLMVARATQRYSHGSLLSEKQGIQWLISESAIELYQAKLMVLHAAYLVEHGLPFATEVSMAKHHVANTLVAGGRPGRAGPRGPRLLEGLAAGRTCSSRPAGAASPTVPTRSTSGAWPSRSSRAYNEHGTTRSATGDLPL